MNKSLIVIKEWGIILLGVLGYNWDYGSDFAYYFLTPVSNTYIKSGLLVFTFFIPFLYFCYLFILVSGNMLCPASEEKEEDEDSDNEQI